MAAARLAIAAALLAAALILLLRGTVASTTSLAEGSRSIAHDLRSSAAPIRLEQSAVAAAFATRDLRVRADELDESAIRRLRLEVLERPVFAPGWVILRAADPAAAGRAARDLRALPGIDELGVLVARQQIPRALPDDPLFNQQWHLASSGSAVAGSDLQVTSLWDFPDGPGVRGSGIRIGIVDDGIETAHPDLAPNIDVSLGRDWNDDDYNPEAESGDIHGTACAGLAAALGGNGVGVVGAAPEAGLVGLRLIAAPTTDLQEAQAMAWRNDVIPIKSNSWGPPDGVGGLEGPGPLTRAALASATSSGRGGLGTVIVWAAGNGGESYDDSNYDGYANSIHTIAVGSTTSEGAPASYSERGANILVCAPSSGTFSDLKITTTDRTGEGGYESGDYTSGFIGSSASAALASGVIALMLEANPLLNWRDVREILIRSAHQLRSNDPEWIVNGAGFWFHPKLGAGLIDASAAVSLATGWTSLGSAVSETDAGTGLGLSIPENNPVGVAHPFEMPPLRCEQVTVKIHVSHSARGNLEIHLTSPSGTVSRLAGVRSDLNDDYPNWTFSSVRHWGEDAAGVWTLKVADRSGIGNSSGGTLNTAELTIHGSSLDVNHPPEITKVHLTALGNAYADRAVDVALVEAEDPDGDSIELSYQWQSAAGGAGFADVEGETGPSLPPEASRAGELWRCQVRAEDGHGGVATAWSAPVNLLGRPPPVAAPGSEFSYQCGLAFAGPAGEFQLAEGVVLPAGLSLNPSSGLLSGIVDPQPDGLFVVQIERTTPDGGLATHSFELTIGTVGGFEAWTEGLAQPAPDADPDGNGIPNLVEYALGAPSGQVAETPLFGYEEGVLSLEFRQSLTRSDVELIIERNGELRDPWSIHGVVIEEIEPGILTRRVRAASAAGGERDFLRMKAIKVP